MIEHEIGVLMEGVFQVSITRIDSPKGNIDGFRLTGDAGKMLFVPVEMVHRLAALLIAEVENKRVRD